MWIQDRQECEEAIGAEVIERSVLRCLLMEGIRPTGTSMLGTEDPSLCWLHSRLF